MISGIAENRHQFIFSAAAGQPGKHLTRVFVEPDRYIGSPILKADIVLFTNTYVFDTW